MATDFKKAKVESEIGALQDEITKLEHNGVKLENEITAQKRKYEQELAELKQKFDSELKKGNGELLKIKQEIAQKSFKLAGFKREIAEAHKQDVLDAVHGKSVRR